MKKMGQTREDGAAQRLRGRAEPGRRLSYVLYEERLALGQFKCFRVGLPDTFEQCLDMQFIYIPGYIILPVPRAAHGNTGS